MEQQVDQAFAVCIASTLRPAPAEPGRFEGLVVIICSSASYLEATRTIILNREHHMET